MTINYINYQISTMFPNHIISGGVRILFFLKVKLTTYHRFKIQICALKCCYNRPLKNTFGTINHIPVDYPDMTGYTDIDYPDYRITGKIHFRRILSQAKKR